MKSTIDARMLPVIDTGTYTRCGTCISDCTSESIDAVTMAIRADTCVRYGHCSAREAGKLKIVIRPVIKSPFGLSFKGG